MSTQRPDFVSPEMSRRFARESEVLGRLQHPGIAQIYEAGTADGPHGPQAFFAMELVRGQSLTAYAEGHALDLRASPRLFEDGRTARPRSGGAVAGELV